LEFETCSATLYLAFGGGRVTINLQKGWLKCPFLYEGGRTTANHLSLLFSFTFFFFFFMWHFLNNVVAVQIDE
jgi:hypothetical protein